MLTIEEAIKLFGKEYIPKEVFTDPWEQKRWLELTDAAIKSRGLKKILASKRSDYYAWEHTKTLISY